MGKFSASRPAPKEKKDQIPVLSLMGAKTKEIAQTLGISASVVRAHLKREETKTILSQLRDLNLPSCAVAYSLIHETMIEDLLKAKRLEERQSIRAEIVKYISMGDAAPSPQLPSDNSMPLPLQPGQTRVTALSIDSLVTEAAQTLKVIDAKPG